LAPSVQRASDHPSRQCCKTRVWSACKEIAGCPSEPPRGRDRRNFLFMAGKTSFGTASLPIASILTSPTDWRCPFFLQGCDWRCHDRDSNLRYCWPGEVLFTNAYL
jgi:hypothetical protein